MAFKQGLGQNLRKEPRSEEVVRIQLTQQQRLLNNPSFLSRLPDKGQKIKDSVEQLKEQLSRFELQHKQHEEQMDSLSDQFRELPSDLSKELPIPNAEGSILERNTTESPQEVPVDRGTQFPFPSPIAKLAETPLTEEAEVRLLFEARMLKGADVMRDTIWTPGHTGIPQKTLPLSLEELIKIQQKIDADAEKEMIAQAQRRLEAENRTTQSFSNIRWRQSTPATTTHSYRDKRTNDYDDDSDSESVQSDDSDNDSDNDDDEHTSAASAFMAHNIDDDGEEEDDNDDEGGDDVDKEALRRHYALTALMPQQQPMRSSASGGYDDRDMSDVD